MPLRITDASFRFVLTRMSPEQLDRLINDANDEIDRQISCVDCDTDPGCFKAELRMLSDVISDARTQRERLPSRPDIPPF
jgi:hypothetical protein